MSFLNFIDRIPEVNFQSVETEVMTESSKFIPFKSPLKFLDINWGYQEHKLSQLIPTKHLDKNMTPTKNRRSTIKDNSNISFSMFRATKSIVYENATALSPKAHNRTSISGARTLASFSSIKPQNSYTSSPMSYNLSSTPKSPQRPTHFRSTCNIL